MGQNLGADAVHDQIESKQSPVAAAGQTFVRDGDAWDAAIITTPQVVADAVATAHIVAGGITTAQFICH